ncbi:MAG: ABC transporter permease [Candidatus Izemoplasma sp.]
MNYDDKIKSDSFEFLQVEDKIYDKKFETKPIGYFKDALIRFRQNRTNVVATLILFTIIFFTFFIPIVSNKNFTQLEEQVAFLPPRVPFLEDIGIFDGTTYRDEQTVDLTSLDPEDDTVLGLPIGFNPDLIVEGSLKNYATTCALKDELCTGGETILRTDADSTSVSVETPAKVWFVYASNAVLKVNITEINTIEGESAVLNIYMISPSTDEYVLIDTLETVGLHEISPYVIFGVTATYGSKVKIELVTDSNKNTIVYDSFEVYSDASEEPSYSATGFDLWDFDLFDGAGTAVRQNGTLLKASFTYMDYEAAFGDKYEIALAASEYDEILLEYGDLCTSTPDPDPENPNGWIFPDTCPIVKVTNQNDSVTVDGVEYYSYELILNYQLYSGYDEIPYYYFGTTASGRDLFTLVWVATRTSLLIGFIVAFINISIGVIYGSIAGYYGGVVDILMERFSEIVGRIPWLVTLSIFVALFGPGLKTLVLILIISGWIGVASITRTQFYRYKGREYVLASRTLGAKDRRLIFRHILPNGIGTIITASILMIPYVIFSESTISYLGFGIGHGQSFNILGLEFSGVSVGVLLADGRLLLGNKPYLTLYPSLIISILMITFNMFGNALRDAFNPTLRGSE